MKKKKRFAEFSNFPKSNNILIFIMIGLALVLVNIPLIIDYVLLDNYLGKVEKQSEIHQKVTSLMISSFEFFGILYS